MPWIDEESCTGCGICVDECPVDAISMKINEVTIDMAECIRCGVCHDVCPEESVRHDSEKIPDTGFRFPQKESAYITSYIRYTLAQCRRQYPGRQRPAGS